MIQKYLAIIFLFLIGCKPIEPVNFVEVQNVKIKRRTLPDGTIEEDITVTLPDKLKAIELDTKLSGQFKGYLSWKEMEAAGQLPRQSRNFNN